MKMTLKRALAMLLSLALAIPGIAFAEEAPEERILQEEMVGEALVLLDEDIEPYLPELGELPLEALLPEVEEELTVEAAVSAAFRVSFVTEPADAAVTVYSASGEATAEADGTYLLPPGDYFYDVTAEGYEAVEGTAFSVDAEDVALYVDLAPEAEAVVEPTEAVEAVEAVPVEDAGAMEAPFDQSRVVGDVIVSVKADPGVFPADAALDVRRVPLYEQQRAEAAVDAVRDGDANVAVSYTFDIRVLDAEGNELQPADGRSVSVAFSMAEVADENLTTSVYHIEDAAEKLEVYEEDAVTAVVETEGFSLYTVEFTYNDLEYVLRGDAEVALNEVLSAVGLTGEVTDASVSDASLFSVSAENGAWTLAAHRSFTTKEWLKVTVNGVGYEIAVTDDLVVTTWQELNREMLQAASLDTAGDKEVRLGANLYGGDATGPLTLWTGMRNTFVLDLNGYTIDRGMTSATNHGVAITVVQGILIIRDSSAAQTGMITGGYTTGNGGGIYVVDNGTLTVEGGTICGNRAEGDGGGVYSAITGKVNMTGGAIINNTAGGSGGGIYAYRGSTVTLTGGKITGNTAAQGSGVACENESTTLNISGGPVNIEGLYLLDGEKVNVNGALDSASYIGVTVQTLPQDGAKLSIATASADYSECFVSEQGLLTLWDDGSVVLREEGIFTWAELQAALFKGGEVVLNHDIVAAEGDGPLMNIREVTLDLNGYAIDRNLGAPVERGCVMLVGSKLTITDSSPDQTGRITGGNNSSEGYPGGIYVTGGSLTLAGGSITGNRTAYDGGGVIAGRYFKQTGGSITGNIAGRDGGGVFVISDTFEQTGGTVTGNEAGGNGGGIWGTFKLNGVDSIGNTAGGLGGDVYASAYTSYLIGKVTVGDLYKANFGKLTADGLDADSRIRVTTEQKPAEGSPVTVATASGDCSACFESADTNWQIAWEDGKVVLRVPQITTWAALQQALYEGGTVKLARDITAGAEDYALQVLDGPVTLDLNGHTIDRNLDSADDGGYVLYVGGNGDLTVTDSSAAQTGIITGGYTGTTLGGAVLVDGGSFTLEGGNIAGNKSEGDGAGVYLYGGKLTVSGGNIIGNIAEGHGGGVYVKDGAMTVSGEAYIKGNEGGNVYLSEGKRITVLGALKSDSIGVTPEKLPEKGESVVIAASKTNCAASFVSDDEYYVVEWADGEARLTKRLTPWETLQKKLDAGGTVKLTENVTAGAEDTWLTVTKDVTLDLNGYTVDRNLTKKASDGSVFYVTGGKLTVTDTSAAKRGKITGGYAESGGGVRIYGGDLALEAGHITGNQANVAGGGVHIARGTFTMNGGSIEGNRADGEGGGVYVYAYVYDSAFIQNGGSVTDNTAKRGGGVYEFQNPFESKCRGSYTLNGGSVSGNHATYGGGVYVERAAFTLNGGGIVDNAAQYGGGLYVMAKDEAVALKGGSITGNTADQKGSGVYHSSGILRLAGGPVTVADNTGDDLYIFNELNTALAVEGTLNGASNIRVSVEHAPSEDTPKVIGTADTDCSACFTSADESYVVTWRNGQVLLATPEAAKSPWTRLQEALNAGGTVKLTEDVTAEAGETILIVGAGAKVTLDLNGHTIDRGLKEPVEDGGVLRVTGGATLTVTDSSAAQTGRITGGNTTGSGGGIHIRGGAVTMSSASVTGNAAKVNGGGVYVENGLFYASDVRVTGNTAQGYGGGVYLGNGTLMLYSDQMEMEDETLILPGAAITGNEAAQGGGVYMAGGAFNVSGIPTVKDNAGGNIYLPKGKALTVDRALEAGAALAVTMAEPGAFTSGLKNYRTRYEQKGIDPAAFFASDDATLAVGLNADNEATLHRHVPGETPEWTWTEDYTAATAAMKCAECGEAFWTETATVTGPAYDEAQKKFVLTATAAHADKTYTDTRAFEAVHNEEKAPEIDETGTYHSGIIECYSVTMGTRTLYFAAQDGKPGEPLEDGAWKLDWFEFDAEAQAIVRYTGGYGEGTTAVELPSHIVDPENEEKKIELTQLGGGDQRFLDMQAAAGGAVTVTDRGSIAYIAPGAFDSHKNVTLALTGDQAITVAEDAFDTAEDVTLRVNHASGLTAGDCDDVTGVYTVELADAHTYKAEAVFADDYATAQIVLTCACGETHTFDAKEITRTEDMTTHRFAFTATGEYEGAAYTAEIKDVESFKVTVNANDGQGDQECYVPKAQGKAYAMFAASAEWLAGLVPPLAADIDELSADGMRYPGGQTVKIEKDTEFTAKWKSIWAKVDAALGEGKSVKLYSDIAPAEGDVYLHVPAGVSAALDMDGHTVDRRLTQAIARGYVILVDGTLNLKNGTVTGGDNTGNGGGVFVNSTGRLEATGGVHVYKNLSGQNGGGVYIAEGGALSVDGGSITYNQAQAKGGGLYIGGDAEVAIDDQETPENAMKPLNAGPVPASAYMRSCQIARNIAENGGGFYVDHGQISMDSGFECINNTDQSGKYNNIDVDPKQSDPFKLPENPVADLIKLGVPGSLAGGAGGTSWLSWLFGAIAGTAAIGGGIAVMLYDDHKEKDSEGEEYSDQGKDCKHPRWSTRTFWEESHYSNVQEFRTCTVCGLMVKNTLTPTNKVIDGDVTEYTVTRTDGQQEKRQVPPYTAILDASMPGGAELPSGFEGTQIKTIPHKKGEGGRLALPETIWFEVDGLIFEGWLVGDSIVTGVDFPADTQEKTRVRIRWKLPVKYEAGVTAAEDPSLKGADPQSPNPSWVTPGSTHVVRENTWSRDDYDFNGWEVSSGFSLVWDGKKLSLEYSFGDAEGVGAGTPLVILVPTVLRAKWISKWKKLDNELNAAREGSEVSMKENVTGTRDDVTMILTSDSTLDMRGFTLDANGGKPNTVLNVFDVANKLTVKGAGTIKNGKNLKGGAVVVLPKGTFKLEDATITDNVAEAIDGQADGGAVYVSGEATFEMTGGTLKNNRAANHGGAVVVAKDGSFKMTGGEISGNKVTADKDAQGGGVYVEGSFKVSGKVVVKDNTAPKAGEEDEEKKDKPSNVYLTKGAVIEVVDKLDEKAELHVTMAEPGVITKGLNAKDEDETKRRGVAENFVSDDEDYRVVINDDGEAELTRKFKITVKDGIEHGKVEPSQETAWADEVITLTVKPDDGYNMKEDSLKGTYKVKEDGQEVEKTVELEMMTDSEEQKYRFTMPAADVEVSVEFEQIKPAFKSHSLLLNGEIGVNFFMELPALEGVDYEKSYMEFTVKSKDGPKTVARYDAEFKDTRGRGYYGFTCNVNAIQMAAPIEAVFHYGDDQTVSQTYSVKHYVTAYEKVKDQYDASITALVHALADYGHYAQPALSEANGWKIGTDYAEMDVYYTKYLDLQTAAKAVARYRMKLDFGSSKVEKVNYTLNLLSQTELRVLIALKDGYKGDVSFKLDGQPVEAELQPDGRYRVTISNIPAQKLDDTHTVSAITTTGTATCTLAPLTYVDWFIQTGNIRINREAMAALYYYYKAAMDYWDVNG